MPDKIVFLHQVRPGGADKSYGIEAGRLAGLPATVISRARQVMSQIEQHSKIAVGLREQKDCSNPSAESSSKRSPLQQPRAQKAVPSVAKNTKIAIKTTEDQTREIDTYLPSIPLQQATATTPEEQLDIFGE